MKGVGEQSTRDANATILRRLKAKEIVDEEASCVCVCGGMGGGIAWRTSTVSALTGRRSIVRAKQKKGGGSGRSREGAERQAIVACHGLLFEGNWIFS